MDSDVMRDLALVVGLLGLVLAVSQFFQRAPSKPLVSADAWAAFGAGHPPGPAGDAGRPTRGQAPRLPGGRVSS
jgi:hypothetical protein